MFKVDNTKRFVRGVLQRIFSHYRLYDLAPYPQIPTPPNFACVNEYTREVFTFLEIDIIAYCSIFGSQASYWLSGVSYIFLCPTFWRIPIHPSFPDCPTVRKNKWAGPGQYLSAYQSYILIHEMVHFYLGTTSLGAHTDPSEVYPINDCVRLNSYNSLHNPSNYQYYVACRSFELTTRCH